MREPPDPTANSRAVGAGGDREPDSPYRSIHLLTPPTDTEHRFSGDTRTALDWIFELLIRALTGAPRANYNDWDQHPARTVEEVFGLLAAAATFARTYGDPAPAV
ncbi:hypothetical protein ABT007_27895 [Streptomyces griseus]|uniref:DUF6197 family protein n=1 Tax=Streptomyces griseus TaxID=1911 RepID=UPI003330DAB6